jgi:hypothetical protein
MGKRSLSGSAIGSTGIESDRIRPASRLRHRLGNTPLNSASISFMIFIASTRIVCPVVTRRPTGDTARARLRRCVEGAHCEGPISRRRRRHRGRCGSGGGIGTAAGASARRPTRSGHDDRSRTTLTSMNRSPVTRGATHQTADVLTPSAIRDFGQSSASRVSRQITGSGPGVGSSTRLRHLL